ncbi:MAG: AzlC family ABC transporter permease [Actinomycetes bacterium]
MTAIVMEAVEDAPLEAARHEFRRGALTMLPLFVGYAPFGCLIGVAVASSAAPWAAWFGVWLVFGGTAHLAALQLVDAGTGIPVAVVSALVVNLRLALFSATLSPHWRGTPLRSRLVAAATLIDPTWMLATKRASDGASAASVRSFYSGSSLLLWVGWAAVVTVGALAGNLVPPGAGLTLLAPLCLLAIVLPGARSRTGAACVAVAALVAAACADLPAGCGLLLAMPSGVAAAAVAGRIGRRVRA